ncbi:hypothetical protein LXL04_032847 [Taraxacum kok-saghyz]
MMQEPLLLFRLRELTFILPVTVFELRGIGLNVKDNTQGNQIWCSCLLMRPEIVNVLPLFRCLDCTEFKWTVGDCRSNDEVSLNSMDFSFTSSTNCKIKGLPHSKKQRNFELLWPHHFDFKVRKKGSINNRVRGIGECCAKLFAEHGAKVVVADIEDQLGQAVCESIGSSNSIYVHCDITNEEDVKNVIDTAVATYGKLDIMFNNAGVVDTSKPRIMDMEKKDIERVLGVNVIGTFLCMKHAARVMVPRKAGSIISASSLTSHLGGMATHAYLCSKHAMVVGILGTKTVFLYAVKRKRNRV